MALFTYELPNFSFELSNTSSTLKVPPMVSPLRINVCISSTRLLALSNGMVLFCTNSIINSSMELFLNSTFISAPSLSPSDLCAIINEWFKLILEPILPNPNLSSSQKSINQPTAFLLYPMIRSTFNRGIGVSGDSYAILVVLKYCNFGFIMKSLCPLSFWAMLRSITGLKARIVTMVIVANTRSAMKQRGTNWIFLSEFKSNEHCLHFIIINLMSLTYQSNDNLPLYNYQLHMDRPEPEPLIPTINNEFPIEPILSCDQSADHFLHEVELTIGQSQNQLGKSSLLKVQVRKLQTDQQWEITRKYEDCQWLFNALKSHFPGTLLPYFPALSVQLFLQNRAKTLNLKLHKNFYSPRLQELAIFLSTICKNPQWGKTEEVQAFLLKGEEFQKRKDEIVRLVEEAKLSSKTFSIYSFFSRSLAWFSNKEEKSDPGTDLLRLRSHLNTHSTQLSFLLQKFAQTISLKTSQMAWNGAWTQIDSVQRLRAKIMTSKSYNQRFVSEIQGKLMVPLIQVLKRQAQINQQIEERTQAGKLLQYLHTANENIQKIQRFAAHIQKFDATMLLEWQRYNSEWKDIVGELDIKFRAIWKDYCESMAKIWK